MAPTFEEKIMDMIDIATLIIRSEEGYQEGVYYDSLMYPTIGIGLKIGKYRQPLEDFDAFPKMPLPVAEAWAKSHLVKTIGGIKSYPIMYAAYGKATPVQQAVILSMCYQMGCHGAAQFKNTWGSLIQDDSQQAAAEMLNSRWAQQTPNRANRQSQMMSNSSLLTYYHT